MSSKGSWPGWRPVSAEVIREEDDYSAVRVHVETRLASARLPFHVDVNVGDPIWPEPITVALPRLRGGEPIELRGYPIHMVHAEKIVTAAQRGTANTRGVTSVTSGACPDDTRSTLATFGTRSAKSRATETRAFCHWRKCSTDSRLSRRAGGRSGAGVATPTTCPSSSSPSCRL